MILRKHLLRSVVVALTMVVSLRAGTVFGDERRDSAREHFDRALTLADQRDFRGALAEFLRAYEISRHPAVLYNIGRSYAELGMPVESANALQRYLDESGATLPGARKLEVESEISRQRSRTGVVIITTAPPGALVRVDGVTLGTTPLSKPVTLPAGRHLIDATLDGHVRKEQAVLLGPEENQTAMLELSPVARVALPATAPPKASRGAEAREGIPRSWGYPLGVSGIALAAAATVFYVWSDRRFDDWKREQAELDRKWSRPPPYSDDLVARQDAADDEIEAVQRLDKAAVGLGIGAISLLGAGTAVLVFGTDGAARKSEVTLGLGSATWETRW